MKLTTTLLPLFLSSFAASTSLPIFGSDQTVFGEDNSVPGANPLTYCQSTDGYSLKISNVDLTPNPPSPGKQLTIEATGNFTQKIEDGAYINLSVKYGLIRLINTKTDLCEQMKNIDEECPLSGAKKVTKNVEIPKEVPPGKYTVLADVYTKDNKKVTCLEATVHF